MTILGSFGIFLHDKVLSYIVTGYQHKQERQFLLKVEEISSSASKNCWTVILGLFWTVTMFKGIECKGKQEFTYNTIIFCSQSERIKLFRSTGVGLISSYKDMIMKAGHLTKGKCRKANAHATSKIAIKYY